ncbi:MAG: vWA domain-containing protein [Bryobacteraceae bacterium]
MHPDLNLIVDRPVFAGILIDASGSMRPYVKDVIEGHKAMLDALRKCEHSERGVLWIYQSLLRRSANTESFYSLSPNGEDRVSVLDASNYQPDGCTALYDAVLTTAKEIEALCESAFKRGLPSDARMVVITDGEDSCSQASPEDVQLAIKALHVRDWRFASVLNRAPESAVRWNQVQCGPASLGVLGMHSAGPRAERYSPGVPKHLASRFALNASQRATRGT